MPGGHTLRSLDASHAIPTRVLRFEDSGLRRRDEDMTPMHTTTIGAWNGVEEVQQRLILRRQGW
jgi:hypothetical protein